MGDVEEADIDLLDFFAEEDPRPASSGSTKNQANVLASREAKTAPPTNGRVTGTAPLTARVEHRVELSASRQGLGRAAAGKSRALASSTKPSTPDFSEAYSGLRVRNRLLSAEDMRLRMTGRKVHRLGDLRTLPRCALESEDPSDAWATLGVLVSKSPRRQAANGGSFVIWTLSNLSSKANDVALFLFQEALGSHWAVCEGTLVALLSPKALPAKESAGGKADQRLAFSVHSPWQIGRVGMAMDYAVCRGKRKDGRPCTMPVNKTEGGGYCEFHVVAAFNRTQRRDTEGKQGTGTGGGGGGGGGSTNSNGAGGGKSLSAHLLATARPGRQNSNVLRSHLQVPRATAGVCVPSTPSQRQARAPSCSRIINDTSRRKESMGAGVFGSGSAAASLCSASEARPLHPTAVRAAGRTTVLSSSLHGSPRAKGDRRKLSSAASPRASVRRLDKQPNREQQTKTVEGDESSDDDILGLRRARRRPATQNGRTPTRSAHARFGNVGTQGSGGKGAVASMDKKKRNVPVAARGHDSNDDSPTPGTLDTRPPAELHPAGYMDGSVPVPAQSKVFLQNAIRFNVRANTSNTNTRDTTEKFREIQMLAKQHCVKQLAQARGITLRRDDPNFVPHVIPRPKTSSILGVQKRKEQPGTRRTNAKLGQRKGSGDTSDPFAKKIKTMSVVEKELLLQRVSKYAGLAEEERAKDADRSMQRLENREAMADKAEEVTKMAVTVYHCKECKMRRTFFSKRCKDLGHEQKGLKATLRFFECTNCRRRTSCTDRIPQTGCEGCGKHNVWKRCGARAGRGHAEDTRDKRFVTAVSEWTDQRDLSLAADMR